MVLGPVFIMDRYQQHQNLIKEFFKAVTKHFPNVTALPYTVGIFRDIQTAERIIHAGVPGVPDILLLLSNGQYLFFDAKTGNATFNKNQRMFIDRLASTTGKPRVYKLTNIDEALKIVRTYEK